MATPSFDLFLRYDTHGVFSSPRALFMFRSYGHQTSSILDGGLPRWLDEGLPIETTAPTEPAHAAYQAPKIEANSIRSKLHLRFIPDSFSQTIS